MGREVDMRAVLVPMALVILVWVGCSGSSPKVELSSEEWNFGELLLRQKLSTDIVIKNVGRSPLEIEGIRSTCDCVLIGEYPEQIAPGDSAILTITYIADAVGEQKKTVYIETNDKENSLLSFKIRGVVSEAAEIRDSSFAVLPFEFPGNMKVGLSVARSIEKMLVDKGFHLESGAPLVEKIKSDPGYLKQGTDELVRKYAAILGLNFALLGDIRDTPEGYWMRLFLIDTHFDYYIPKQILASDTASLISLAQDTVASVMDNLGSIESRLFRESIQAKWLRNRAKMMNKPAPPIELPYLTGGKGEFRLADYKGKVVLMHFFSEECEHCREEIEWLSKLDTLNTDGNLVIVAVSIDADDPDGVKRYIEEKGIDYPVLLLPFDLPPVQDVIMEDFFSGMTPQIFVIDKDGLIRENMVGFNKKLTSKLENLLKTVLSEG